MMEKKTYLSILGFAAAMGSMGNGPEFKTKKIHFPKNYNDSEASLKHFEFEVNGKHKRVYAINQEQANEKARKNKWI